MQNDNAAFHYDPNDPIAPPGRSGGGAKMDLAYAAALNNGTLSEPPMPLRHIPDKVRDLESAEYEPFDNREVDHPLSNFDVMFHMMKASCGSGILAMPLAFYHAGYAVGLVGTVVIGFICTYCVHILIQSEHAICKRRKVPSLNYHEIAREGFKEGPTFFKRTAKMAEYCEHTFLCIYQMGTMSVYTVFIANSLYVVVKAHGVDIDIRLYMCMLLVPLILINFVRNLKYLAPLSTFALVATVVAFSVTLKFIFTDLPPVTSREPVGEIRNLPLFFGTVIFALEAIGVVVPLGNEMRRPRDYLGITGVLNRGMVPIVLLYVFMGFFGYIKYGEKAAGSITLNLPDDDLLAQAVKLLIAVAIFGTHPLQCYVVVDIIWGTYLQPRLLKNPHVLTIEYVVRASIVTVAFLFAVAIPNLGPFISLVGALSLSMVGIMLPALVQLSTFWYQTKGTAFHWLLVKNVLLSVFAIVGLVSGTYSSIVDIMSGSS